MLNLVKLNGVENNFFNYIIMPHKIHHPIRDKIIRNENKLRPVLKKELKQEQKKKNMYK